MTETLIGLGIYLACGLGATALVVAALLALDHLARYWPGGPR